MNKINMIACVSKNGAIGYNNELIYNIKEDLQRFKDLTKGNIVLMGRKTFESIIHMNGKPLPNRINVVLTTDPNYVSKHGEIVFNSAEEVIKHSNTLGVEDKEVFIIGGGSIYTILMPYVENLYLTVVDEIVEYYDTKFPLESLVEFDNLEVEEQVTSEGLTIKYKTYSKKGEML